MTSCPSCCSPPQSPKLNLLSLFVSLIFFIFLYFLTTKLGLKNLDLNPHSTLPFIVVFGLISGVSTCSALTGSLLLSFNRRFSSHLFFHLGRLLSFTLLGGILGLLGSFFHFSLTFFSLFSVLISLLLIYRAFSMLGLACLPQTFFTVNSKTPFILGFSTFFFPCGFTFAAQSLALASGSFISAALILFSFALGTLIPLIFISFFASRIYSSRLLTSLAAVIIIFFSASNLFSQSAIFFPNHQTLSSPSLPNKTQVIRMSAQDYAFVPNHFTLRAHLPVRWEITDAGFSGCTNTIISSLLPQPLHLNRFSSTVAEFTPTTPGTYNFSCSMGMVNGQIQVID